MTSTRLGVDLFVANRALEAAAYDAIVAAGHGDISPAQARLLSRVADDGSRVGELAERARVSKQTAGHLVDQLARAGYVERVPDPTDGRARLVRLTPRARTAIPVADAAVVAALQRWDEHLGAESMAALGDALARLAEITDPFRS